MGKQMQDTRQLPARFGRKYRMTMIGVAAVLVIGVLIAMLKRFLGVDITELGKWAMVTVTGSIGIGAASIAYEDTRRPNSPSDK